jgi:hypothetical protein
VQGKTGTTTHGDTVHDSDKGSVESRSKVVELIFLLKELGDTHIRLFIILVSHITRTILVQVHNIATSAEGLVTITRKNNRVDLLRLLVFL